MGLSVLISLFLVFAVPVFFVFAYFQFLGERFAVGKFRRSFILGLISFAAAQLLSFFTGLFYKIGYTAVYLYFYDWIFELLILTVVLFGGFLFWMKKGFFRSDDYREFPYVFSYTGGFLVLSGLFKAVKSLFKFNSYILFLYPVILVALLIAGSVILIEASTKRGYLSVLVYLLIIPVSLVMAVVPWLFSLNYNAAAVSLAVFLLIGASVFFILLRKDYTG